MPGRPGAAVSIVDAWLRLSLHGTDNELNPDPPTLHPVMVLRGRGRPMVFLADAIRSHVQHFHRCPGTDHPPAERAWMCGTEATGRGGQGVATQVPAGSTVGAKLATASFQTCSTTASTETPSSR